MKMVPVTLAVLVLLLTGCVSTRTLDLSDEDAVAEVNAMASRKKATVTFNPSDHGFVLIDRRLVTAERVRIEAKDLHVAADSISWLNAKTGKQQTFPMTDIQAVRFRNSGRGFGVGLLGGSLIGGSLGALIGYASGDDPPCEGFCFDLSAKDKARLGTFLLGASVGVLSGLIGAGIGEDVYRIQAIPIPPEDPPVSAIYYPPHRKAAPVAHRKR